MNDYALNLINKGVSLVAGFTVSVLLARYLGVVMRGELAFITQTASLLALVFSLGISQAFPYFLRQKAFDDTYGSFVRMYVGQFVAYSAVGIGVWRAVPDETVRGVLVLVVFGVLYQQLESTMASQNIRLKIHVGLAVSTVKVAVHVALIIWFPAELWWPVLALVVTWLVAIVAYMFGRERIRLGFAPLDIYRRVLSFSWMPMLTSALIVMNYSVDTILLRVLGSPLDLGYYALAAGLIVYMWAIPDAMKEVLLSRVVRDGNVSQVLFALKVALCIVVVLVAGFAALGRPFIEFVYGAEFGPSYGLTVLLSLGAVSMVYFKMLGVVMLAEGRRVFYFVTLLAAVIVNIIGNIVLVPQIGAVGAAATSVASYSFTGFAFVWYFARVKEVALGDVLFVTPADLKRIWRRVRRSNEW